LSQPLLLPSLLLKLQLQMHKLDAAIAGLLSHKIGKQWGCKTP